MENLSFEVFCVAFANFFRLSAIKSQLTRESKTVWSIARWFFSKTLHLSAIRKQVLSHISSLFSLDLPWRFSSREEESIPRALISSTVCPGGCWRLHRFYSSPTKFGHRNH